MPQSPPSEAQRVHSRRAFGFVTMSALLPGSVQTFAGNRALGRVASRVYGAVAALVALIVLGLLLLRGPTVGVLLSPAVAATLRVLLWALLIGWVLLLLDAWRLARPLRLERTARLRLTITSLVLIGAVTAATSVAANALVAVGNVGQVFMGGGETDINDGRYNILLLGADASEERVGLRPDSINVASIDAETGETVIFGLPRNLQRAPFPESSPLHALYPDGYVCEDGACMLNGVWTLGEEHSDLYPDGDAGLTAMKEAVGETLGLDINYYALVDMAGFESLIDAMGGIRLDIAKDIPIGGGGSPISGYIEAGENVLLDGFHALWFARSRSESSDYERMVRQKCVMSAMLAQLDPMTVATSFVDLSEAGRNILRTDIGTGAVSELAGLALLAKSQPIASVNFMPPLIVSADPDFELIRSTVEDALLPQPSPTPTPSADDEQSAETATGADDDPTATPEATPTPTPSTAAEALEHPVTETTDLAAICSVG